MAYFGKYSTQLVLQHKNGSFFIASIIESDGVSRNGGLTSAFGNLNQTARTDFLHTYADILPSKVCIVVQCVSLMPLLQNSEQLDLLPEVIIGLKNDDAASPGKMAVLHMDRDMQWHVAQIVSTFFSRAIMSNEPAQIPSPVFNCTNNNLFEMARSNSFDNFGDISIADFDANGVVDVLLPEFIDKSTGATSATMRLHFAVYNAVSEAKMHAKSHGTFFRNAINTNGTAPMCH